MQGMVAVMELSIEDEATAMLARMMYVHHQEFRDKEARPAPFAPEWAFDYAKIAVTYLPVNEDQIADLRTDYR